MIKIPSLARCHKKLVILSVTLPWIFLTVSLLSEDKDNQLKEAEQIFLEILADDANGLFPKTYNLSEKQLNAFLQKQSNIVAQNGLNHFQIDLKEENLFTIELKFDTTKLLELKDSLSLNLLANLLAGGQTLTVDGKLASESGQATYHLLRASIGKTPVPAILFIAVLDILVSHFNPPVRPGFPFALPYSIDSISLTVDTAYIHRRETGG
jgi:hypothetical protein